MSRAAPPGARRAATRAPTAPTSTPTHEAGPSLVTLTCGLSLRASACAASARLQKRSLSRRLWSGSTCSAAWRRTRCAARARRSCRHKRRRLRRRLRASGRLAGGASSSGRRRCARARKRAQPLRPYLSYLHISRRSMASASRRRCVAVMPNGAFAWHVACASRAARAAIRRRRRRLRTGGGDAVQGRGRRGGGRVAGAPRARRAALGHGRRRAHAITGPEEGCRVPCLNGESTHTDTGLSRSGPSAARRG